MKRFIPNTLTSCNVFSGCLAVALAFHGDLSAALCWIIMGAVFDFFDGLSARALHVTSPMGKELDSLADVITFGLAPSVMLYVVLSDLMITHYPSGGYLLSLFPYVAFLIAVFSALRLAKFNIDTRQTDCFIGLPTPANALLWGSLLVSQKYYLQQYHLSIPLLILMALMSCYLLICEKRMLALKFKAWGWQGNALRYIMLICGALLILFFGLLGITFTIILYILISFFGTFFYRKD